MSDSSRPHRLQPTRLLRPWDFPGKNTGVDFHFLFQGLLTSWRERKKQNPEHSFCFAYVALSLYFFLVCAGSSLWRSGFSREKAMAPHSSTLAWKIPWTEEPGGLQSMGLRRVRHDWATSLSLFTFIHWRRKWQPTPVFFPRESQGQGSLVGCRLWSRTESDWSNLAAAAAAACTEFSWNWCIPEWKHYRKPENQKRLDYGARF